MSKLKRKSCLRWVIPSLIAAVLITGVLLWYFLIVDNVADEIILEAGGNPKAEHFKIRDWDIPISMDTDPSRIDMETPGTYPVVLSYYHRKYDAVIRVRDTKPPKAKTRDVTMFFTEQPTTEMFVDSIEDVTDCTVRFEKEPDMTLEGKQQITLIVTDEGGNETSCSATLTVIMDREAPVIEGVTDLVYFIGNEPDMMHGITVTDALDPNVSISIATDVDFETPGTYTIEYSAEDTCGNRSAETASVTVILDEKPPVIMGVFDQSVCVGTTISYRKSVIVQDDYDLSPTLTVDSSKVDLSTPGDYPIVYTAVDAAGNESTAEAEIHVHKKTNNWVEEDVINEEVEKAANKILKEGMTAEEQVRAIYQYVHSFYYSGHSDKTDWKQAGYQLLRTGQGDCYSFFGLSKLLFEYADIPNIDVHRMRLPVHYNNHIWNMVSVDGGETYYYYDATPYPGSSKRFCLVTDAYLDEFSASHNMYFSRDRSILPTTPTTPLS